MAASTCALSFGMLCLFQRYFIRSTPLWRVISDGALTTYVLQWLVLHGLLAPLMALGFRDGALFWALILCTLAIKLPFHHFDVARVPLLSLLLNGTPIQRAKVLARP